MSRIISLNEALDQVNNPDNSIQGGLISQALPDVSVTLGLVNNVSSSGPTGFTLLVPARLMSTGDVLSVRNEFDQTGEATITSLIVSGPYGPHYNLVDVLVNPPLSLTGGTTDAWQFQCFHKGLSPAIEPVGIVNTIVSSTGYGVLLLGQELFSSGDTVFFLTDTGSTGTTTLTGFSFSGSVDALSDQYLMNLADPQSLAIGDSFVWKSEYVPSNQDILANRRGLSGRGVRVIRMQV